MVRGWRTPSGYRVAAFAAAMVVLFSGGTAQASCGDYLTIHGEPTASHDGSPVSLPKKPCHGPNCSVSPAPPESPLNTTSTKTLAPERDPAALGLHEAAKLEDHNLSRRPRSESGTISRPSVPFHPPKSA